MKKFKFEIKEWQEDGTFYGVASMYGNVDYGGDVVERGAFTKTINEKKTIPILWQHKQDIPIGVGELEDTDRGLMIRGKLNLEVLKAKEAYSLIKQGAIKGLSIGYDVVKDKWDKGIRYLKELRLWEVSVVTFPMNSEAVINSVKSVVSFQNLPLAELSLGWDGTVAERNVRLWATDSNGDINWERYQKAFLWFDSEKPENFTSYKLGIADIIDGELKAIPRGIMTAAGSIQGARNKPDIPENDLNRIKVNLEKYYSKMDKIAPWNKSESEEFDIKMEVQSNKEKIKNIINELNMLIGEIEVNNYESVKNDNSKIEKQKQEQKQTEDLLNNIKQIFDEMQIITNKNKEEK
jgi:HK97 family phage prohead protease